MNRSRSNNHATASLHFYSARIAQQQQQQNTTQNPASTFTSTAKLPIETVKQLIAAVAVRPNLWIRHHSGQKRYDINQLWQEVSLEIQLPADVCRIKWGHLRDNFRKVFIRNTLSDETPTTWRFYNDMRFMEKSVAENIMRQNRYKDQTRYWPELQQNSQQLLHPMIPICTLKENVQLDLKSIQNLAAYAEASQGEANKRIKLEPPEIYENGREHTKSKNSYTQPHEQDPEAEPEPEHGQEPEPDDDDFDEDTATEENDIVEAKEKIVAGKGEMFPIEVFDDDDDDTADNAKSTNKNCSMFNGMSETVSSADEDHSNNFPAANMKKTETLNTYAEDSDRMFLLSLLPYLRNVDVNRKLRVRQRLQNVLIEELP